MREFLINVAAGVALSAAGWLLVRVAAPLYLAWRYQAPRLQGNWNMYDSDAAEASARGTALIQQNGERLLATVVRTTSRSGKPLSRTFRYRGKVREGQLLLSFEEPVSGGFIAGNLVLKVSGDLKTLAALILAVPEWTTK